MQVVIQPDAMAAAELVAQVVAGALRERPRLVLGLATGSTMDAVYARLCALHRVEGLDFSACRTFNLDEYVGLPASHPNSYRHYMNQHLFSQVNIDQGNTHVPDGAAPDLEAECRKYEGLIDQAGGIDLQLLGIGRSGHIGFNEPLSALNSRTRVEWLAAATLEQNAPHFKNAVQMPRRAITMGVGTILDCRRCLLLATGPDKADILARAVEGPLTAMVPASALQMHPDCTVIADQAAASRLKGKRDYQVASQNDPKWKRFLSSAPAVAGAKAGAPEERG
ncbi:MAG TPA: glucosamine-6-phosphate deaminase [Candidatus Acidoferrales bacterium]|nr:glucosamine-6-phosphate deaminase [Candidatus Acidoferrales bacterium]